MAEMLSGGVRIVTKFSCGSGRVALLASLCLVGACSSSGGNSAATNADTDTGTPTTNPTPTPTPAPPPTTTTPVPVQQAASGTYDESIGMGVDSTGSANLPLRPGAHRYFVNSVTGSDASGCAAAEQPATPLRSIAIAVACVKGGNGDQVLVAEGTSYAEGLPVLDKRSGYSNEYPTVIQSYDPSDPTNDSKYGRAANGRRPIINTGGNAQPVTCCGTTPGSYLAIRGFDINPGNLPGMTMMFVGTNGMPNNYVLIENNIFRYTQLGFNQPPTNRAIHHVVRKNAFYGSWSGGAHAQGVYNSGTESLTVEDNVFWHAGWKVGASRDAGDSLGGATMFNHAIYQQSTSDAVIRRNLFMDSSATGCMCRGDTSIQDNVFIDEPIAISAGVGDDYTATRPNGIAIDIGDNAIIGDADITTILPRGYAISTGNGKRGSTAHHNLILRSRNPAKAYAFSTEARYDQPSYMNFDSNLVYLFSNRTYGTSGNFLAQDFPTYTSNIWDSATSGSNTNNATVSFPNPYTEAQLFAALGCSDKATCTSRMIETPELGWGVKAHALLWQGYGF